LTALPLAAILGAVLPLLVLFLLPLPSRAADVPRHGRQSPDGKGGFQIIVKLQDGKPLTDADAVSAETLLEKTRAKGRLYVTIELLVPFQTDPRSTAADALYTRQLRVIQSRVLSRALGRPFDAEAEAEAAALGKRSDRHVVLPKFVPFATIALEPEPLSRVLRDAEVKSVTEFIAVAATRGAARR
jgi:hypothetical protein